MRWITAIGLVLVMLSCAEPASADSSVPLAWQQKALALAQRVWHPACGTLTLVSGDPVAAGAETDDGKIAPNALGWWPPGTCTVAVNAAHDWKGYPEFCTVVLHEGGHATGHAHSDRGVMRPTLDVDHWRAKLEVHGRLRTVEGWDGADRRCLPTRS